MSIKGLFTIIVHNYEAKIKYKRCETSEHGETVKIFPSLLFFENRRLGAICASVDYCLCMTIDCIGRNTPGKVTGASIAWIFP